MKVFQSLADGYLLSNTFSLRSHAQNFLDLVSFGFVTDGLTITVFEDVEKVKHFYFSCLSVTVGVSPVGVFDAVSFYESVLVPGADSGFCKDCVQLAGLSNGSASGWFHCVPVLRNMILYTDDPITDVRFFHTVSFALYEFEFAIAALCKQFQVLPDVWFEKVIETQKVRLNAAREFFLNDLVLLCSQLHKMLPPSPSNVISPGNLMLPGVVDTVSSFGLTNVTLNDFTGSLFVAPVSNYFFQAPSLLMRRFDRRLKRENKLLDVLELLFVDVNFKFLVAPYILFSLYKRVALEAFGVTLFVTEVPVPFVLHGEFVETLKVLSSNVIFEDSKLLHSNNSNIFDVDKVESVIDSTKNLTLNP